MPNSNPCGQECPPVCAEACAGVPLRIEPIRLDEAQARFEREAAWGVCDTGRYRMRYYTWGEGPPLLFIHGVCDSSRAFVLPVSRLARDFRCIAYDLPTGRGDGARLGRITHADLVADVWALLDHVGARQSYVLGSSFGSTVALAAMRERPARLPRGILQGALAGRRLRWYERPLAHAGRYLPGTMAYLPGRRLVQRFTNRPSFAARGPEAWQYFLSNTGRGPIKALAQQALLLHRLDLRPLLADVRQPVLLLCGDRDPVVPPAYQDVLMHGLPSAGRVILKGCGHVPMYTHPELFAEVVRQFLTPAAEHPCGGHGVNGTCASKQGGCDRET